MLETFIHNVSAIYTLIPFTGATWFLLGTLAFFVWLFSRASRDPHSGVNWEHLFVDSTNDRASPYKLGYLIGVIVSTWIVLTMSDKQILTFDILGMYLTYLATGVGINMYAKNKQVTSDTSQSTN